MVSLFKPIINYNMIIKMLEAWKQYLLWAYFKKGNLQLCQNLFKEMSVVTTEIMRLRV